MKRVIISTFVMLLPFLAFTQNKTYLGVETGPKFERYQYTDNGDGLYTPPFFFSPIVGFTIGQELNKRLTAETGFYLNNYGESYRIRGEGFGYRVSDAYLAFQIPLRLKARFQVIKERLSIVPSIGFILAINNNFGSTGSGHSFTISSGLQQNDSTRTQESSTYSLTKTYGLVEAGLAVEYTIKKPLILYLATNYAAGWNRVVEMDVQYWINDGPEQTGMVYSNGGYYSLVFGVKCDISNLWTHSQDE
ncbi:MAG: hypothetical protein AAF587_38715 [Bacteroidota bacterium]